MNHSVCPVWIGHFLANPLRKLIHNPWKILFPYVKQGAKAVDIGSAMGFFSIPMAEIAGEKGNVICVDLQEEMLEALRKRAAKAGVESRLTLHKCSQNSLDLKQCNGEIDFALIFAVAHEVPDKHRFFDEVSDLIKPGGKILLAEPKGHVKQADFDGTVEAFEQRGFKVLFSPQIALSMAVMLEKE
ncbi:MAG: class I SAM-dependent methyltransferase [Firmicutes bacterium]|nr:class I SAM-dependent methyltransferase [Bacillota bacterium]